MKKKLVSVLLVFVMILSSVTALAVSGTVTGSGTSDGGTMGQTSTMASMTWANYTTAGTDRTAAKTESDASGKLGVRAVLWYTGPLGNDTKASQKIQYSCRTVSSNSVKAPSTSHGYKATSGHTYESVNYGFWVKGLSKTF